MTTRSASGQDQSAARASRVDSLFSRFDRTPSPGLAVAVVRDGRVVLRRGYGLADIEHGVPITPATVFDVASLSKQFAGFAVAMLVTEGKLRMEDPARLHVPQLHDFAPPVTIDHLVHHTSGLRDWPGTLAVGGWRFDDVISFQQILTLAYAQRTLNFTPGAEHLYSNTGYNVLAEAVQRVVRRPFRAHIDSVIFRPLGMTASRFLDDHTEIIPNRAFGYARSADGTFRHTPNALTALGSSSMYSSVDDLARWLVNMDSMRVGGAEAMLLWRRRGRLIRGDSIPYAFGISHGTYRGVPTLSHSGSWASFRTYLVYMPVQRTGVAVLANGNTIDAQNAAMRVAEMYLDVDLALLASPPAASAAPSVPSAVLDEYAGLYRLGPGWYTRIRRDGASLTSQATDEEAAPMTARGEREFWIANYGQSMWFVRDAAGKVNGLTYRGSRAPRVQEGAAPSPSRIAEYAGDYESEEAGTTYRVVVNGAALELRHRRHGTMPMTWRWRDDFGTGAWFLRSVEFTRDAVGRVDGFVANGDARSRDIRFRRR